MTDKNYKGYKDSPIFVQLTIIHRQHRLSLWNQNDPRSLAIRKIAYNNYKNNDDYKRYISPPELVDQKYRLEEDKKRLEYRQNNYF